MSVYRGLTVERVRNGTVPSVAHETCDAAHGDVCDRSTVGLGLDGDSVLVLGQPFRRVPR